MTDLVVFKKVHTADEIRNGEPIYVRPEEVAAVEQERELWLAGDERYKYEYTLIWMRSGRVHAVQGAPAEVVARLGLEAVV